MLIMMDIWSVEWRQCVELSGLSPVRMHGIIILWVLSSDVDDLIGEVVQPQRRPLLGPFPYTLLNVKAVVSAFNQDNPLEGAFSVIVKTDCSRWIVCNSINSKLWQLI